VDELGFPLDADVVTPVASSAHNSFGETSKNRSVGLSFMAPPMLHSRSSHEMIKGPSLSDDLTMMPPPLCKAPTEIKAPKVEAHSSPAYGTSNTWILPKGSVKCKPDFWPCDPMSNMIMNSDAQSVATRISDCLKRRNISASYGVTKAKAKCVSNEMVEFRIRLYAGKGRYTGGVIVEVQRRSGWSHTYQQDCYAILESAECDKVGDCDERYMDEAFYNFDHISKKSKKSDIVLSKHLLFSGTLDSLTLGLQSICSLTDPRKFGKDEAISTAQSLLLDEENAVVKELFRSILIDKEWDGFTLTTKEAVYGLAIKCITNSISLLAKETNFDHVLKFNKWIESDLVSILMNEVNDISSSRPDIAVMTTRCVNAITSISADATGAAISLGILKVLER